MTKRRRAHGEGSVYFDAHRAKWVGTIDLGPDPATGKRAARGICAALGVTVRPDSPIHAGHR